MLDGNNIAGLDGVINLFEQVGKAPAKVLTKATRVAALAIRDAARQNAPVDPAGWGGTLRKNIVAKAEKTKKGKKYVGIYVKSDPNFVKISKAGNRSFYPASQEFGWTDQYGHHHAGYHYMRRAADQNSEKAQGLIVDTMKNELEKLK